jgi:uracil-DNA glycosylase
MNINSLQQEIINCRKCPRLIQWAGSQQGRKKEHAHIQYWGKPVPGFGDLSARLVVVGLAPGAHGANRTGRPFTGDVAGIYLYQSLYATGFASQARAVSIQDGLQLTGAYITNAVRCAPPDNKPTTDEFKICRDYLQRELELLLNKKVILTLGKNAFDQVKGLYKHLGADTRGVHFAHNKAYDFGPGFPAIIGCYHTSQYNINTNRMSQAQLDEVFNLTQSYL